jgi:gamma-D-glutamyl-L-lysine dipeptidyl-peptidase
VSPKLKSSNNNPAYGVCNVSIAALRKDATHTSEMVSQMLFGESFTVLDSTSNDTWDYIKNSYDNYEGWLHKKHYFKISKSTFIKIHKSKIAVASEMQSAIILQGEKTVIPILAGSELPLLSEGEMHIDKKSFNFKGKSFSEIKNPDRNKILKTAFQFLHAPYLWGGRSEFGIDCSGFSQLVYKLNGIKIPRDAYQQAEQGTELDFIEEVLPGDLAFFDNESGKITHVGIVISPTEIIHASGTVHIDGLNLKGIYEEKTGVYSHHLRSLQRFF